MKLMIYRLLMAVFAIGLCSDVLAEAKQEYPQISLCGPGGSKNPKDRNEFIILVIEGPNLFYDTNPVPSADAVEFVNNLLKVKDVSYIGVYTREGTKFGDVIRALDILRKTKAKNIGVSMEVIPFGREP